MGLTPSVELILTMEPFFCFSAFISNLANVNNPKDLILKIVLPSFILSLILIFVCYKKANKSYY